MTSTCSGVATSSRHAPGESARASERDSNRDGLQQPRPTETSSSSPAASETLLKLQKEAREEAQRRRAEAMSVPRLGLVSERLGPVGGTSSSQQSRRRFESVAAELVWLKSRRSASQLVLREPGSRQRGTWLYTWQSANDAALSPRHPAPAAPEANDADDHALRSECSSHAEACAAAIRQHRHEEATASDSREWVLGARRPSPFRLSTWVAQAGGVVADDEEQARALIGNPQPCSSSEVHSRTLSLSERASTAHISLAARAARAHRHLTRRSSEAALRLHSQAQAVRTCRRTCIARLRSALLCEPSQPPGRGDGKPPVTTPARKQDGHSLARSILWRSLCFSLSLHVCALLLVSAFYALIIWWHSREGG